MPKPPAVSPSRRVLISCARRRSSTGGRSAFTNDKGLGESSITGLTGLTGLTGQPWPASLRSRQRQPALQDHGGGVVIAIQDEPTARTEVRAHAERLADALPARGAVGQHAATVLAALLRRRRHRQDSGQPAIVLTPAPQTGPAHIRDRRGHLAIAHQGAYRQVLQGQQVVSADERARGGAGDVLALPLEMEVCPSQPLLRLPPV